MAEQIVVDTDRPQSRPFTLGDPMILMLAVSLGLAPRRVRCPVSRTLAANGMVSAQKNRVESVASFFAPLRLCVSPQQLTQATTYSCIIRVSSVFHPWLESPILFSFSSSFPLQTALIRGLIQSLPRLGVKSPRPPFQHRPGLAEPARAVYNRVLSVNGVGLLVLSDAPPEDSHVESKHMAFDVRDDVARSHRMQRRVQTDNRRLVCKKAHRRN